MIGRSHGPSSSSRIQRDAPYLGSGSCLPACPVLMRVEMRGKEMQGNLSVASCYA